MKNEPAIDSVQDALADDRREWIDALESIHREFGEDGVRHIVRTLQNHAVGRGIVLGEPTLNTAYVNTIPVSEQPAYPGNLELEKRIENIIRWNAMAMVLQAQDAGTGVGGHFATYTSASTMLEVGFNHFFRAAGEGDSRGDIVLPQRTAPLSTGHLRARLS